MNSRETMTVPHTYMCVCCIFVGLHRSRKHSSPANTIFLLQFGGDVGENSFWQPILQVIHFSCFISIAKSFHSFFVLLHRTRIYLRIKSIFILIWNFFWRSLTAFVVATTTKHRAAFCSATNHHVWHFYSCSNCSYSRIPLLTFHVSNTRISFSLTIFPSAHEPERDN